MLLITTDTDNGLRFIFGEKLNTVAINFFRSEMLIASEQLVFVICDKTFTRCCFECCVLRTAINKCFSEIEKLK